MRAGVSVRIVQASATSAAHRVDASVLGGSSGRRLRDSNAEGRREARLTSLDARERTGTRVRQVRVLVAGHAGARNAGMIERERGGSERETGDGGARHGDWALTRADRAGRRRFDLGNMTGGARVAGGTSLGGGSRRSKSLSEAFSSLGQILLLLPPLPDLPPPRSPLVL